VLERLGLDKKMQKASISDAIGHLELSHLAGIVLKWYVFVIFLGEAAGLVNFGTLSLLMNKFLFWLPNLFIAFVILVLGVMLADFLYHRMSKVRVKSVRILAGVVKVIVVFFIALIALNQAGFYVSLAENAFLIILAGVVLTLAISIGIGFGLAMKEEARGVIRSFRKRF